jgi:hypothetical protein
MSDMQNRLKCNHSNTSRALCSTAVITDMTYFKIAEEVRVGETVHVTRIVDLGEECHGVGVCEALRGQGIPQSIRCTIAAVVHGFRIVRTRCDLHAMSQGLECLDTHLSLQHAKQDKTRQDKTRQDKTRQDKTRQSKARMAGTNRWL